MEEGLCAGLSLLGSIAIFELLNKPTPRGSLAALLISAVMGFGAGRWIVRSHHPKRAIVVSAVVFVAVIVEAAVPAPWHHLLLNTATWHEVASLFAPLRIGPSSRPACWWAWREPANGWPLAIEAGWGLSPTPLLPCSPHSSWSRGRPRWSQGWRRACFASVSSAWEVWPCWLGISRCSPELPIPRRQLAVPLDGEESRSLLLPSLLVFLAVVLSVAGSGALGTGGSPSWQFLERTNHRGVGFQRCWFCCAGSECRALPGPEQVPTYWQVRGPDQPGRRNVGGCTESRAIAAEKVRPDRWKRVESKRWSQSQVAAHVTIRVVPGPRAPSSPRDIGSTRPLADPAGGRCGRAAAADELGEQYVVTGSVSAANQRTPSSPARELMTHPAEISNLSLRALSRRKFKRWLDRSSPEAMDGTRWFRDWSTGFGPVAFAIRRPRSPWPHGEPPPWPYVPHQDQGRQLPDLHRTAFAMMAQSLGIPVRVAVGFNSGAWEPSGETP